MSVRLGLPPHKRQLNSAVIVSSGSGYSIFDTNTQKIEIFDDEPRFKSWPRDCSIIYEPRIVLTMSKDKRGEIYKWLHDCGITWTPIDNTAFKLHDVESLTMFKMVWL